MRCYFCWMSVLLTLTDNGEDGPHHAAEHKHLREECLVLFSSKRLYTIAFLCRAPLPVPVHRGLPCSLLYRDFLMNSAYCVYNNSSCVIDIATHRGGRMIFLCLNFILWRWNGLKSDHLSSNMLYVGQRVNNKADPSVQSSFIGFSLWSKGHISANLASEVCLKSTSST